MEWNEKLQALRKQKGLTQEELAQALYVSRTAVSKWESGRGYPNIDSLKAIAAFFGITIDELLSGDQLLTIAHRHSKQQEAHLQALMFGLLDVSVLMLLFLPFFRQMVNGVVQSVSLLGLTHVAFYMQIAYGVVLGSMAVLGFLTLVLQTCEHRTWLTCQRFSSLAINVLCAALFILGTQPYAAIFLFFLLVVKGFLLLFVR